MFSIVRGKFCGQRSQIPVHARCNIINISQKSTFYTPTLGFQVNRVQRVKNTPFFTRNQKFNYTTNTKQSEETKEYQDYLNEGIKQHKEGKMGEALECYQKALQMHSKHSKLHYLLANVYINLKKYNEAKEAIDKAIKLDPGLDHYYFTRGNMYLELRKFNEAIADLTKAISLSQKEQYYVFRSHAYQTTMQYAQAIEDYTKLLKLSPQNGSSIYLKRGYCYHSLGEISNAIGDYTKAIEEKSPLPTGETLKMVHIRSDQTSKISPNTQTEKIKMIKEKERGESYYLRGMCRMDEGHIENALDDVTAAIAISPSNFDYIYSRSKLYLLSNQLDKAKADLSKSIELQDQSRSTSPSKSLNPFPYFDRAKIAYSDRLFDSALADLNSAISINSSNSDFYLARGKVHYAIATSSLNYTNNENNNNNNDNNNDSEAIRAAIGDFEKAISLAGEVGVGEGEREGVGEGVGCSLIEANYHLALSLHLLSFPSLSPLPPLSLSLSLFESSLHPPLENNKNNNKNNNNNINNKIGGVIGSKRNSEVVAEERRRLEKEIAGEGYFLRSRIYYSQNQFDLALSDISKSIDLSSNPSAKLYQLRGELLYRSHLSKNDQSNDQPISGDEAPLDLNNNAKNKNNIINLEKNKKIFVVENNIEIENRSANQSNSPQVDSAIGDLTKSIKINPKNADGYSLRAIIQFNHYRNFDQAIADFNSAIALQPNQVDHYLYRAQCYRSQRMHRESNGDFSKIIEIDPLHIEAYYGRAINNYDLKKYKEAEEDIGKAIELAQQKGDGDLGKYNVIAQLIRSRKLPPQPSSLSSPISLP